MASPASEDEDLKRAIALSLADAGIDSVEKSPDRQDVTTSRTEPPSTFAGLGVSRKEMEEQRLARLKRKRTADISPPPLTRHVKPSTRSAPVPHRNHDEQPRPTSGQVDPSQNVHVAPTQAAASRRELQYPEGVVKKTWCFDQTRNGDDIKIEEVLDAKNLQSAVLSSFIWDFDWLFPKLDTKRTKFVLVLHAKEPGQKRLYEQDFAGIPNVRLCFPPMTGIVNCMHSKLMLLFYPDSLRVVVPSANLMSFDWGEDNGVMENSVFLIDLPRKGGQSQQGQQTLFQKSLLEFVTAMGLQDDVIRKLEDFDFYATREMGFVHSIGGMHRGSAWRTTGLCGLGRTVASLGLHTTQPIQVDFVTSSVGSLNAEFMRSIYLAAQGDDGLSELTLRSAKTFPAQCLDTKEKRLVPKDMGSAWKENFRFYFPTDATVRRSRGGPGKAGTVCFQAKWWLSASFPRGNIRDCVSVRPGLLMHNKTMFVRFLEGHRYPGWAYVGSANLSESAWGRLVRDAGSKSPKLNCRNWECGVVIPLLSKATDATTTSRLVGSVEDLSMFQGIIPVPMEYPGSRYGENTRPWSFGG